MVGMHGVMRLNLILLSKHIKDEKYFEIAEKRINETIGK